MTTHKIYEALQKKVAGQSKIDIDSGFLEVPAWAHALRLFGRDGFALSNPVASWDAAKKEAKLVGKVAVLDPNGQELTVTFFTQGRSKRVHCRMETMLASVGLTTVLDLKLLPAGSINLDFLPSFAFPATTIVVNTQAQKCTLLTKVATNNWALPGVPAVELSSIALKVDKSQSARGRAQYAVRLMGNFTTGETVLQAYLQVPVSKPKGAWVLGMNSQTPLVQGLNDLGKVLLNQPAGNVFPEAFLKANLPEIVLDDLSLSINVGKKAIDRVTLTLSTKNEWSLSPIDFTVKRSRLQLVLMNRNGTIDPSLRIDGSFGSGKSTLNLGIDIAGLKEPWTFTSNASIDFSGFEPLSLLPGLLPTSAYALPSKLQQAPKIELEELTLVYDPKKNSFTNFKLNVGNPQMWDLLPGYFAIGNTALKLDVKRGTDTTITGEISGNVQLLNTLRFFLKAEKTEDDWLFSGELVDGEVSFTRMAEYLLQTKLPAMPNLALNELSLKNVSAKHGSFEFKAGMAPWALEVGIFTVAINGLEVTVDRNQAGKLSGKVAGSANLLGMTDIGMSYELPANNIKVAAKLPDLDLRKIVESLVGNLPIPEDINIKFTQSAIFFEKDGGNYLFALGTVVNNWGTIMVQVKKDVQDGWGLLAGIALRKGWKLSDLNSAFSAFDNFVFQEMGLVFSTMRSRNLKFPSVKDFPGFPEPGTGIDFPKEIDRVVKGITFFSKVTVEGNPAFDELKQFFPLGEASLEVQVMASYDPMQLRLRAALKGPFNPLGPLAPFSIERAGVDFIGGQGGVAAGVEMDFSLGLQDQFSRDFFGTDRLKFGGNVYVRARAIDGSGYISSPLKDLFGIKGLSVGRSAMLIGCTYEGVPFMGVFGEVAYEKFAGMLAVYINPENPARSAVVGSMSPLSLNNIVEAFAMEPAPKPMQAVLKQVNLRGAVTFDLAKTSDPELLKDLNATTPSKKLRDGFRNNGKISLTPGDDQIVITRQKENALWFLTDRDKQNVYRIEHTKGKLIAELNPQLYIAPQQTTIGPYEFQEGLRLSGSLQLFGLKSTSKVNFNKSKGLAVRSEIAPINLLNGVLKFNGGSPTKPAVLSISTYEQEGHKYEPKPHFLVRGYLNVLGFEMNTDVFATTSGLKAHFSGSTPHKSTHLKYTVNALFDASSKPNFKGDGSFELAVKETIDLGVFGKIKIDTSAGIAYKLQFGAGVAQEARLSGYFTWADKKWSFEMFFRYEGNPFEDIPKLISTVIGNSFKDIFADIFKVAEKFLEYFTKGLIFEVPDLGKLLREVFKYFGQHPACPVSNAVRYSQFGEEALMGGSLEADLALDTTEGSVVAQAPDASNAAKLSPELLAWLYKLRDDLGKSEKGKEYLEAYRVVQPHFNTLVKDDPTVKRLLNDPKAVKWFNFLGDVVQGVSTYESPEDVSETISVLLNLRDAIRSTRVLSRENQRDVSRFVRVHANTFNDRYAGKSYGQIMETISNESPTP